MNGSNNGDGTLVTQAMVCPAKGEKLVLQDITLPPMKASMVEVDLIYCGLCHTDIHCRDNDWGVSNYPLVLGHEGVARVRALGSACHLLKVGDQVGITWARDSCSCCDACISGRENICEKGYQGTYLGKNAGIWGKVPHNEHGGCFSKVMRIEERFAIKIPESIPPEIACPLICGGGTVFESVVDYVHCGTSVAIASIGGLGTAAIRFSKLFGGTVTALSRGDAKRQRALDAGAHEYYGCLGNPDEMAKLAGKFDVIIDTNPTNPDIVPYMGMLKMNGTFCKVGIPSTSDMSFRHDFIPLIFTQTKIAGTIITGTRRMKRMLDLVEVEMDVFSKDKDDWKTEIVKFAEVNEVMDKLKTGKNGSTYRYILEW